MNNIKKNSSNHKVSFIAAGSLFSIAFLLCVTANNFVSGVSPITRVFSYITALLGGVIICVRYANKNKLMNPDGFNPPRDTFYYIKRMSYIVLMTVLMSLGTSLAGAFGNALFGGFMQIRVDSPFLRGLILKLPFFIIYLSLIYKMFIRYGFLDSDRKIFNPNFKLLTFIITLTVMVPDAVYDSMFFTSLTQTFIVNVQTVLSPNVDKFVVDFDGYSYVNENFTAVNILLVFLTVLFTFAIQTCVAMFAYRRGKKIFMKERIRIIDEYEMDENI